MGNKKKADSESFISGGGWFENEKESRHRPKMILFLILSFISSLPAIWLMSIYLYEKWHLPENFFDWLCVSSLAFPPGFLSASVLCLFKEKPIIAKGKVLSANPSCDPKNLY